ncbi:MAG: biotin/lipoate A/B protein ligase family protein [Candidatus Lokiarchaeota archaeon]
MINSRLIFSKITDPFLNQALEEILLNSVFNREYDLIVRFWSATPSVIVGRNQSLKGEVNIKASQKYQIPIIRRITGGGAVYLDLGCLNFSFYINNNCMFYTSNVSNLNRSLMQIIVNALTLSNLDCLIQPPNSITINGKKISGSAQIFKGNSVLHHGTLLVNTNLQKLTELLNVEKTLREIRYISSKKTDVTNVSFINQNITATEIIQKIIIQIKDEFQLKLTEQKLTESELNQAKMMSRKKYLDFNWLNKIP